MPEASPIGSPGIGHNGPPSEIDEPTYWHSLISETEAAKFLGLTTRSMQAMRQRGGGPKFIRLSSRCIRYTRTLLKTHADARLRGSTSDSGEASA